MILKAKRRKCTFRKLSNTLLAEFIIREKSFILLMMMLLAGTTIFSIYISSPDRFYISKWYNRSEPLNSVSLPTVPEATEEISEEIKIELGTTPTPEKPKHKYWSEFLIEPTIDFYTVCDVSCKLKNAYTFTMVVFIKSKAENYRQRQRLRQTWASIRYTPMGRFAYVYVVGEPELKQTMELVSEEALRFQDLLMYRGSDDYRNINRKTLAGMQWASENLPPEFYYSSGDDDFLVDMQLLENAVYEGMEAQKQHGWPAYPIICSYRVNIFVEVVRDPESKYHIPHDVYQWDKYPRACLGGFYTTSLKLVSKLWDFSQYEPLVFMDDVWITGILRQKIGMPDYSVLEPQEQAAFHFEGYKNYGDLSLIGSPEFMKEEWHNAYKTISEKRHCKCML